MVEKKSIGHTQVDMSWLQPVRVRRENETDRTVKCAQKSAIYREFCTATCKKRQEAVNPKPTVLLPYKVSQPGAQAFASLWGGGAIAPHHNINSC